MEPCTANNFPSMLKVEKKNIFTELWSTEMIEHESYFLDQLKKSTNHYSRYIWE